MINFINDFFIKSFFNVIQNQDQILSWFLTGKISEPLLTNFFIVIGTIIGLIILIIILTILSKKIIHYKNNQKYDFYGLENKILEKKTNFNNTYQNNKSNNKFKYLKKFLIFFGFLIIIFGLFSIFNTNFLFLNNNFFLPSIDKEETVLISGIFFGESTNFSDTEISVSRASLKSINVSENKYEISVNCNKDFVINFNRTGFVPLHKKVPNCFSQKIDISLVKMNDFKKISFSEETIVKDDLVSIKINGNDLIILGTNRAPEEAKVSVTGFNPNTSDMIYFPGELEGINEEGEEVGFVSYGFAKIIAQDDEGNNLDFKEGSGAKVEFLIDDTQKDSAPNIIPLWYFDEERGHWMEEGSAEKVCENNSCKYVGEINKVRSFWNWDEPVERRDIILENWDIEDKECEDGKKIYGRPYNFKKITKNYMKDQSDEYYICCPLNTLEKNVVYKKSKPVACSCPEGEIANFILSGGMVYTHCCPKDYPLIPESAKKGYPSCGKCKFGINNEERVCKDDCSICIGEVVTSLSPGSTDNCEKTPGEDCSEKGMICVEHIKSSLGDPSAKCECPDSLTFVTAQNDFFSAIYDGHEFAFKFTGTITSHVSENTMITPSNPEEIFEKITNYCKSNCAQNEKKIDIIVADHGNKGFQRIGKTELDLEYLNQIAPKFEDGTYDFSCVKEFIFAGCAIGKGVEGKNFLQTAANIFNTPVRGANQLVYYWKDGFSKIHLTGRAMYIKPNNSKIKLETIFYATSDDLYFPGMPSTAYQTKILNGELDEVEVTINSKDLSRNKVAYLNDSDAICNFSEIDTKIFEINSETKEINYYDFKIKIPNGAVKTENVKLQINLLSADCNEFEQDYQEFSKKITPEYFQKVQKAKNLGLLSEELFNHTKTLYENNWECIVNEDCFGPCPIGQIDCNYLCNNHECKLDSDINPTKTTKNDYLWWMEHEDFKEEYSFLISEQFLRKIIFTGKIGDSFSFQVNVPSTYYFAKNGVPYRNNSINNRKTIFSNIGLENCSLLKSNFSYFGDCIIGWAKLRNAHPTELIEYLEKQNIEKENEKRIKLKIADYFNYPHICYNLKNDPVNLVNCVKMVDENKHFKSKHQLPFILNNNLNDQELTFVLRNLAQYYSDNSYCEPIPIQDLKDACYARVPSPTEMERDEDFIGEDDFIEDLRTINLFECEFDSKYSGPIMDGEGNYWIKEINNNRLIANKIAGHIDSCNGNTNMKVDENGKVTPCLTNISKNDDCILLSKEVYTLNNSNENYTVQSKQNNIYKQNTLDFIDLNGNIWFAIDESNYPFFIKIDKDGSFISKNEVFKQQEKEYKTITKMWFAGASKDVYWVVLENPIHNISVKKDSYMHINVCDNTPYSEEGDSSDYAGGFGQRNWSKKYNYGISALANNYSNKPITRLTSKVYCESQENYLPGEGYTGYARLTGTNFNAKEYTFITDEFNNLLVLGKEKLKEYYIDTNNIEYPSSITEFIQ
jgi:hypothetical protein